jgi:hypothetical protein
VERTLAPLSLCSSPLAHGFPLTSNLLTQRTCVGLYIVVQRTHASRSPLSLHKMRFSAIAISVAALAGVALACPFEHQALSKRVTSNLEKRNARMTWYDITTGEVACSGFYAPSDNVVAMNKPVRLFTCPLTCTRASC